MKTAHENELSKALEFIKSKHNGEIPYKYGSMECAKLMTQFASQFREPSTEQSGGTGGTEQRELKMLDPLSNNGWSFDYEAIQTISEETDNYTVDGESDMVSMEGVNSVLIALSKHYIITYKP